MVFRGRKFHRRCRKQRGGFKAAMIPGVIGSIMMNRLLPMANLINIAKQHARRGRGFWSTRAQRMGYGKHRGGPFTYHY